MTLYVLDSSAVVRFLDREAGWERVAAILIQKMTAKADVAISAVQWGEIAGAVRKKSGAAAEHRAMTRLGEFEPRIEPVTGERARRAAALKVETRIAYADAFAAELALEFSGSLLVTADFGFKVVAHLTPVEFLPSKQSA